METEIIKTCGECIYNRNRVHADICTLLFQKGTHLRDYRSGNIGIRVDCPLMGGRLLIGFDESRLNIFPLFNSEFFI